MGEHLDITMPAASQLIKRLVDEQLVDRAESPQDRRVRQLTLTAKGRTLIEKAIEFRNQWIESLHVTLSEKQLETISASLRDLVTAEHDLDRQ
jgi:DNA-binding MarR family transcriptional regulator